MKIVFFVCSRRGAQLAARVCHRWMEQSPEDEIRVILKYVSAPEDAEALSAAFLQEGVPAGETKTAEPVLKFCGPSETMGTETCRVFPDSDALVYFCAAGIAVRSIAPCLSHKASDPAVLCMDERGKFCISLLSGHLGGANALCSSLSEMTGAIPVITTASDAAGTFSPDLFAKEHGLILKDFAMAKTLAAAALEGEAIGIADPLGSLSLGSGSGRYGILITDRAEALPYDNTLILFRRDLILGIGCKKNTPAEMIAEAADRFLAENGLAADAVREMVSIDLKAEEPGIREFCRERGIPFRTFSPEELRRVEENCGDGFFTCSEFVEAVTGVCCVCEESVMAAGAETILLKKTKYPQVTLSIGRMPVAGQN